MMNRMARLLTCSAVFGGLLFLQSSAHAEGFGITTVLPEEPVTLGTRGNFVLGGTTALTATGHTYSVTGTRQTDFAFNVQPTVGVMVSQSLYLGTGLQVSVNKPHAQDTLVGLGVSPRVGMVAPLSRTVSFFPQFVASYGYTKLPGAGAGNAQSVNVGLELPLVFQLAPHAGLTFGPQVATSVYHRVAGSDAGSSTTYGLRGGLLVWL